MIVGLNFEIIENGPDNRILLLKLGNESDPH